VAEVLRTSHVTPHMIRVVLGGDGLADLSAGEFTDHYVKLLFPPGAPDPERPVTRTYTVRAWDAAAGELTLDVVWHGDEGLAGPWAAAARPGDRISFFGPGGGYAPSPDADWHLLAGDASVIPAIAVALARIPAGVPVYAVLEIDGQDERQELSSPGELQLTWLHRSAPPGEEPELLAAAVGALDLPHGRGQAFVHGEASSVRNLRRHLIAERGLAPDSLSISGYWKLKRTEEGWRDDKAEWARLVEADLVA
jgi:NADPH-dependent ferric siderophore reductase